MPHKDKEQRRKYARDYYHAKIDKEKRRLYARTQRIKFKLISDRHKDKPCADCGIKYPLVCMDFDHVRGEKYKNVGAINHISEAVILREIAKCEVVCANCHRIRTEQRRLSKHIVR